MVPRRCVVGRVPLLYVSWFRKVGNESNHHPHIHTGAYSDGEGSEEQSASGGDVGHWEVTFVHCLGGLEKGEKSKRRRKSDTVWRYSREKGDPFFKKSHNYRSCLLFLCQCEGNMQVEDGLIDRAARRNPGELITHGRTKNGN